jgi:sulfide dehydrogenase cytochrome subunit
MQRPKLGAWLGAALLIAGISPLTAQAVDRGMVLSMSCASCHGTDGKSPGAMPMIHGKSSAYLEQAMKEFRDGKRYATVMNRIAKGYSDDEIKLLADYLGNVNK